LSELAEMLSDERFRAGLNQAPDRAEVHRIMQGWQPHAA